ncbi:MBL fold metallo-hydrolase [Hymenobacter defluvii]|uniref:MBL fold metallo-hydrolase n=1 Tax=Hymenobacter defluvii TaxID=2054411 RepID=A0ABS3TA31_9BACT|nr:MBL fold metallo-hydrolase [Hymenobacter defluvii]MBO3270521.1 MBL fold metallo-hydrolase [Hymenobacter defluvii]
MKITKYIHSCLLLEQDGEQLLFDPGTFTFADGAVTPDTFKNVSTVVITHQHPDHLDVKALQEIVRLSGAAVLSTPEVADQLKPYGLKVQVVVEGSLQVGAFQLEAVSVPHEPILDSELPQMLAFFINGKVLNPADSFSPILQKFKRVELLILPVMAPFLTELRVAEFARQLEPQQILPVHDGYAKDFFVEQRYDTYEPHFAEQGIQFHRLSQPGQSVTV